MNNINDQKTRQKTNLSPYELPQAQWALANDCRALGLDVHAAVVNHLCNGDPIVLPDGKIPDEWTKERIREFARYRGVDIPERAL